MKKPNIHFDKKSDTLYISTKKGKEEEFIEIAKGINIELDSKKNVIGIEILNASLFLKPFINKIKLTKN